MIDISGMDKAKIFAALYNNSKPQGLGHFQYDPQPMSEVEAGELLEYYEYSYFDYVKGRVIKTDFEGDELDPWGYDRDNGNGAMQQVIEGIG